MTEAEVREHAAVASKLGRLVAVAERVVVWSDGTVEAQTAYKFEGDNVD